MAGSELSGVDVVVAEIAVAHPAVLESDQSVPVHDVLVELDLDLRVLGDRQQRRDELVLEEPFGFVDGVDVGVEPVSLVGQLLHRHVVEVAHAEPDRDQVDATVSVFADHSSEVVRVGDADVRDPVGGEHHPVDPVAAEGLVGEPVTLAQTCLEVRRPARPEPVDRVEDHVAVTGAGRFEHDARAAVVGDDRDGVVVVQLVDQDRERLLHQPESVVAIHRARGVDHEREGRLPAVLVVHDLALHADADQVVVVVEGRWPAIDAELEPVAWCSVVVIERVDVLLRAHRLGGRELELLDPAPSDGVGAGVDVEGERRERVDARLHEVAVPVVGERVVLEAVRVVGRRFGIGAEQPTLGVGGCISAARPRGRLAGRLLGGLLGGFVGRFARRFVGRFIGGLLGRLVHEVAFRVTARLGGVLLVAEQALVGRFLGRLLLPVVGRVVAPTACSEQHPSDRECGHHCVHVAALHGRWTVPTVTPVPGSCVETVTINGARSLGSGAPDAQVARPERLTASDSRAAAA